MTGTPVRPVPEHPWRGRRARSFPDLEWIDDRDPLEEELHDKQVVEAFLRRLGMPSRGRNEDED